MLIPTYILSLFFVAVYTADSLVSDTAYCRVDSRSFSRPKATANDRGGYCDLDNVPTEYCTFSSFSFLPFNRKGIITLPPAEGESSFTTIKSQKNRDVDFNIVIQFVSDEFAQQWKTCKQKRMKNYNPTELKTVQYQCQMFLLDDSAIELLLNDITKILSDNNLSGAEFLVPLDVIQYPNQFLDFVSLANQKFKDPSNENPFSLITSVPPNEEFLAAIDPGLLSQNVDYIVLLTEVLPGYDSTSQFTVPRAPLYQLPDFGQSSTYAQSVEGITNKWLDAGVDPSKFIIGFDSVGNAFTTSSNDDPSVGLPVVSLADPGPYTATRGSLAYFEFCSNPNLGITVAERNSYAVGTFRNLWTSNSVMDTMTQKGIFVNQKKLRGFAISVCDDDYDGRCGSGTFPLTVAANIGMIYGINTGRIASNPLANRAAVTGGSEVVELPIINGASL